MIVALVRDQYTFLADNRCNSIAQRVKAQVLKKHKEDIGSEKVPKQI